MMLQENQNLGRVHAEPLVTHFYDDGFYNWLVGISAFFGLFLPSVLAIFIPEIKPLLAPFCHQLEERSFSIYGHAFGLCARCTGIYLTIGVMALFINRINRKQALSYSLELVSYAATLAAFILWLQDIEVGNGPRFLFGISHGIAVSFLVWRMRLAVLSFARGHVNADIGNFSPPIPPFRRH